MKQKRIVRALAAAAAAALLLPLGGCGDADDKITVRYLNFKPEIAAHYEELARSYEQQAGVRVIVDTAANNTYEQTLAAKMATSEAPTLFQINGPRGYAAWKDYCADLKDTQLYAHLTDKALAMTDGGAVVGLPYVVEGYGILYNKRILSAYLALPERGTTVASADDIRSFSVLSAVVRDMQAHAEQLGIRGVFASASLKAGEDWRYQTHLPNVPLWYEWQKDGTQLTDGVPEIRLTYGSGFGALFDLYLDNAVTDKKLLGSKTVADSMAEFALGQCAMVQNGNWAWEQIAGVTGNTVRAEDLGFLPMFIGAPDEERQGLCIGTENYYAINKKASGEEQKAAADFIWWLYSSTEGKKAVTEKLGFIAPFDTFGEAERPTDPLAREVLRWMDRDNTVNIPWAFTVFPSQTFKEDLGASLLKYAQGGKTWDAVERDMIAGWKKESAAAG